MAEADTVLLQLTRWTSAGAVVWPRAGVKCEYCDASLVGDFGTYRWGTPYDHILPRSRYLNLLTDPATASWLTNTGTQYRNIALACHFCNLTKNNYDPGADIASRDATDLTDEQRQQLVERLRERFGSRGREQWAVAVAEYERFLQIMRASELADAAAPTTLSRADILRSEAGASR